MYLPQAKLMAELEHVPHLPNSKFMFITTISYRPNIISKEIKKHVTQAKR